MTAINIFEFIVDVLLVMSGILIGFVLVLLLRKLAIKQEKNLGEKGEEEKQYNRSTRTSK